MKERPILFNGAMVLAILKRWKTNTRRVVNLRIGGGNLVAKAIGFTQSDQRPEIWYGHIKGGSATDGFLGEFTCPYGKAGDQLWVRETWAVHWMYNDIRPRDVLNTDQFPTIAYRASYKDSGSKWGKWRPSIHMPRWACRIELVVKSVRVERLNSISEEDARAEGVYHGSQLGPLDICARPLFKSLWDSINEKRGYGWEKNPWVWVIEFEKIEGRAGG